MAATSFFKVYPSDTTVTLDVAPYDATFTKPTVLKTVPLTPAVGCHSMDGWDGFEIMPYVIGEDNADMRIEVWLWYKIQDPNFPSTSTTPNAMYAPIKTWTWDTNAILASTFVGVASTYVPATARFCDTIGASDASTFGTFIEKFHTDGLSNAEEYSPTGDLPGMIKVPWCNDAHAIHVHLYDPDAAAQQNYGNALMRFTRLPGNQGSGNARPRNA